MRSIQTKLIALVLLCVLVSCLATGGAGLFAAQQVVDESSAKIMNVLCEEKAAQLDAMLDQVEQSVQILAEHVQNLMMIDPYAWQGGDRVEQSVSKLEREAMHFAENIPGVHSVYFRLLPVFSGVEEAALWHSSSKHIDPTEYSFWDGLEAGFADAGVWMEPERRAEHDAWAAAYAVPVLANGETVGLIGMDVDTSALEAVMDNISLYDSGYAFLADSDGIIIYHPSLPFGTAIAESADELARILERLDSVTADDELFTYKWDGEKKAITFRTLENGMYLAVTVPMKEITVGRNQLVAQNIYCLALIVVMALIITNGFTQRLIYPLRELDEAARKIAGGDFSVKIEPRTNDEIGTLARSFQKTSEQLQRYISELNSMAYRDTMTGVRNKSAYLEAAHRMQTRMEQDKTPFALMMVDVNHLKYTNDTFGHEFGDELIIGCCRIVCRVFEHSPVYRFGGDEFVVILEGRDYDAREALIEKLRGAIDEYNRTAENRLRLSLSWGIAEYDSQAGEAFSDVFKRADENMYENKKAAYAKMEKDLR